MKQIWLINALIFLAWGIVLIPSLQAQQFVTPELRLWAQEVIEKEETIDTISASNTIAILYFVNKTHQKKLDPLKKGIPFMLITDLSTLTTLQVLERIKIEALTEEIALKASGMVEVNNAPRMGKLLRARWVLSGEILEGVRPQLLIQSHIVDIPHQTILSTAMTRGELQELIRMEKELLFNIIKLLKIKLTPVEEEKLRKPMTQNIKALMALFKAIEAGDMGDFKKSVEFYKKALKEDPEMVIPKEALLEIKPYYSIPLPEKNIDNSFLWTLRNETSHTDQLAPEDYITGKTPQSNTKPASPVSKEGHWNIENVN